MPKLKWVVAGVALAIWATTIRADNPSSVSFGADYRWRIDEYRPLNFGLRGAEDTSSVQQRFLVHADFHFDDAVRAFVQLGAAREHGRPIQRPGDEDEFDAQQAFVDFSFDSGRWRLRAGRQEVTIGRFVTIREGTNFRRTFDGARLDGAMNGDSLLAVAAQSTRQRPGTFDDDPNPDDSLGALVWSHPLAANGAFKIDTAFLEHRNRKATYQEGAGRERRHTLGVRLAGTSHGWDVDAQASYQFGSLDTATRELDISAWGAAFEGGRTQKEWPLAPRFALRIDAAGGDRKRADGTLNTFDLPYPNLTYLSDATFFAPRNVADVQPFVSASPRPDLTVVLGAQFLWRVSSQDAVYSSANVPLVPAGIAGSYVATQPYARVAFHPCSLISIQASIEKAFTGDILSNARGRGQLYESLQVAVQL